VRPSVLAVLRLMTSDYGFAKRKSHRPCRGIKRRSRLTMCGRVGKQEHLAAWWNQLGKDLEPLGSSVPMMLTPVMLASGCRMLVTMFARTRSSDGE
jgi:hypothetical protein